MSGSNQQTTSSHTGWNFNVGDLVGLAPTRVHLYDYDGYYYPGVGRYGYKDREQRDVIGVVIEVYEKYGYFSDRYYKIKWFDNKTFSNERHEDLMLISAKPLNDKD